MPGRQTMSNPLIAGLTVIMLMVPTLTGATVEQNGARFDERIEQAGERLRLTGTGVAKYRIVFTVYAAGLYLPPDADADQALATDTPRRLEIQYFHDISAEDIIRAANTKLDEQLSPARQTRLQPKIDRFHALFQAVSDGDRYRMEYIPGEGTRLAFNGKPVGQVSGGDFAAAYFGIWLDADDPLSRGLRRDLLAGAESSGTD
ncbi:hypothetical protein FPL11_07900 [Spiribacter aquaticus]|uniref:Chalcone isomerase domain-containing protein n=2 Tax=Ectothiorhodospiraceae TaxID=72276 RepID=A0A557RHB7_9GAMM|nr:hypothetical protein BA897_08455 [Spiribacter roseus]TVO64562.1 hypothetical protein FPL11_07900 [Spiribacter aquaticus]